MSMQRRTTFHRFALPAAGLLAAAAATLSGCSSSSSGNPLSGGTAASGSVVVGSNNFAESVLLADIYGQALANKGVHVTYKYNIGSREVTYGLIKAGTISLLPEYNGALLAYLDKSSTQTSTSQVDSDINTHLASTLEILQASSAQDNDTLTLSKQEAANLGLSKGATISDFVTKLNGNQFVLGGSSEFQTRQQGVLGLESVYGLKSSQISYKQLDSGGPLTEAALSTGQVQAGDLFTTDPTISQGGLLTLVDDKNIFGLQDVLPLGYKSAITTADASVLNAVSAKLDSASLLTLDTDVQVQKQDPLTVAKQWLQSEGLS